MTVVEPFVGGVVGPVGPGPAPPTGRSGTARRAGRSGAGRRPVGPGPVAPLGDCDRLELRRQRERVAAGEDRARAGSSLRRRHAPARARDARSGHRRTGGRGRADRERRQRRRAALAQLAETEQREHQHRGHDASDLQRLAIAIVQRHPSGSLARHGGGRGARGRRGGGRRWWLRRPRSVRAWNRARRSGRSCTCRSTSVTVSRLAFVSDGDGAMLDRRRLRRARQRLDLEQELGDREVAPGHGERVRHGREARGRIEHRVARRDRHDVDRRTARPRSAPGG